MKSKFIGNEEEAEAMLSLLPSNVIGNLSYLIEEAESILANDIHEDIQDAARTTQRNPTVAQTEAGNYKKGKFTIHGLTISLENPAGSIRRKIRPDGKTEWARKMEHHYGYVNKTEGSDGDHVDIFIGPNPDSERVFVIDQVNEDGAFDEHKCMLGFDSQKEAEKGYLSNYPKGWKLGPVTGMSVDEFKQWLKSDTTKKLSTNAGLVSHQEIKRIGSWLKTKGLMPGYGQIYVKGDKVWYVGGDGDDRGFDEIVKHNLLVISGVDQVRYEPESFPKEEGWIKVYDPKED